MATNNGQLPQGKPRFTYSSMQTFTLVCPACKEPPWEPVEAECGDTFCGDCMRSLSQTCGSTLLCPSLLCRQPIGCTKSVRNKLVVAQLASLRVACGSCGKEMNRGSLVDHVPQCQRPCPLCGIKVSLSDQETHENTVCTKAIVWCEACRTKMLRSDLASHISQCPERLGQGDCTPIFCRAKVYGCSWVGVGSNLQSHEESCKFLPLLPVLDEVRRQGEEQRKIIADQGNKISELQALVGQLQQQVLKLCSLVVDQAPGHHIQSPSVLPKPPLPKFEWSTERKSSYMKISGNEVTKILTDTNHRSAIGVDKWNAGQYYFIVKAVALHATGSDYLGVGIASSDSDLERWGGENGVFLSCVGGSSHAGINTQGCSYPLCTANPGDSIGVLVDCDNSTVQFFLNGKPVASSHVKFELPVSPIVSLYTEKDSIIAEYAEIPVDFPNPQSFKDNL